MKLQPILDDIQNGLNILQQKVNIIRTLDTGKFYEVDVQMTRKEAAEFIGRSVRQVDRLCDEHKIKRIYVGGSVRILKSSLLDYKGLTLSHHTKKPLPTWKRLQCSVFSNALPSNYRITYRILLLFEKLSVSSIYKFL